VRINKSSSTPRSRFPIPRIGFLGAATALWMLCSGGVGLGNARVTVDKGAVADKASGDEKDNSSRTDAVPRPKTDANKSADSANTGPAPAAGSTEDQIVRLGDKVKKLQDTLEQSQQKADEKVTRLEEIIEHQQQKSDEKVAKLEEIIDRQQKALEVIQSHLGGNSTTAAIATTSGSTVNTADAASAAPLASPAAVGTSPASSNGGSVPISASGASASNGPAVNASAGKASPPVVAQDEEAPLSLRIGSAYITPTGFADFTTVFRSTNAGNGLPTNFGSIPFSNTTAGQLTEIRPSAQASRLGTRVDAMVAGAHVIGEVEFDFLGFVPTNSAVVYNNSAPRLRLAFVDVRKDKIEILGGQAWSLMSPDRNGLSPLPEDLYYPHLDPDNQLGLVWNRDPQFRFIYHASDAVTMGFSVEEPEQYIGGFGGAGTITLPSALATPYATELNNGTTTLNTPNVAPDFVAKIAFDPRFASRHFHIELAGVERNFRVYNPLTKEHYSATGGGGSVNLCLQVLPGVKLIAYNYYSDGGGRYIFGQAPDLVIRGDGSISLVHSASTVEGAEFQVAKNTLLYAYYGGVYIGKDAVQDPVTHSFVGYGFPGASTGQNRILQEPTFGLTQTLWKDVRYGQLQFGLQYSYVTRSPWIPPTTGPTTASTNMVYVDLRYLLPGAAPKLPYSY
jgi:TolA-binding protein